MVCRPVVVTPALVVLQENDSPGVSSVTRQIATGRRGSREGLLVAVVRAVEARQRHALTELREQASENPAELAHRSWRRLADPELAPHERLFFELYGQALVGQPYAAPLLDGVIDDWLEPLTALLGARPTPAGDARVDAAFERFVATVAPTGAEP